MYVLLMSYFKYVNIFLLQCFKIFVLLVDFSSVLTYYRSSVCYLLCVRQAIVDTPLQNTECVP